MHTFLFTTIILFTKLFNITPCTHAAYVPDSSAGFDCRYGGGVCLADSMCDRLTLLPRAHNADMIYCTL